jgi:Domain of unknown function (DUF4340)
VAGAIWLSLQRSLPRDTTIARHVLPDLAGALNDINQLSIVKAGKKTSVTLKRTASDWQVAERAGYAADSSKVRKLLIDLSQLETVEEKTSNPKLYAQLGVEDVDAPAATGVSIELAGSKQPVNLIVGKTSGTHSTFVRVPGQPQSYLATPQITVDSEPANWLDRNLLDIAAARVQEARVQTAGGAPYTVKRDAREQTDFTVPNLPKGRALSSPTAANSASSSLTGLTFDDVRAAAGDEDWSKGTAQAEFRLFDGTVITIRGRIVDDKHWIRVTSTFDPALNERFAQSKKDESAATPAPAVMTKDAAPKPATPAATQPSEPAKPAAEIRTENEALAKRTERWVYSIPGYKYDTIFRPLDQLLQPLPTKPAKDKKP